jgi:predicted lipid-binding transport protein (Tim44 family)
MTMDFSDLAAFARPGGGEGFSGGSSSSSSGGGGAGAVFEVLYWLLRLTIAYPQVGGPLLVIVIGYIIYSAYRQNKNADWDSGPPVELHKATSLDDVKRVDPEFSPIVFEDFCFRLFSTAQRARATAAQLDTIAPYVSEAARAQLAAREPKGVAVEQVIVGALRAVRADVPAGDNPEALVRIGVEFEANVLTAGATAYSVETWLLARGAGRKSKPPGQKTFPCPNCGAPWQAKASGSQVCASCGQAVDNGRFDWVVQQISVASTDQRPPSLLAEVEERGTDLPTVRQDRVDERWLALANADPALTWPSLQARVSMIYEQLNTAWSNNALEPVRGLVSDGLYDYLQYWVDAYRRQGLANKMVDAKINHMTIAKLSRDRWYDAITIRVWAKAKDFVVQASDDKVVRGSKHRDRAYSEYWTVIRSSGRRGEAKAEAACGNCGAPLKVTMAGACEFCGAHVTAGAFDWVLSKIEQDDTYRG